MRNERLEEIKDNELLFTQWYEDLTNDFLWLTEQAERYDECKLDAMKLHEQNKRYREAISFANDELNEVLHANKTVDVKIFYIENAKRKLTEVLEGESEWKLE